MTENELEGLIDSAAEEKMSEKLEYLEGAIKDAKTDIEQCSSQLDTTIIDSQKLHALGMLILDDLQNQNGLVDSTGMWLFCF